MDVAYFRYQDDILILCQTKCSLNRCKQRLMQVLQERRLRLSGKKTRIGSIDKGFHFLGIQYPKTQPLDNTTMTQAVVNVSNTEQVEQNQSKLVGWRQFGNPRSSLFCKHPLFLMQEHWAKREQVKWMVKDGVSPRCIISYLHRWCMWWVRTAAHWLYQDLLLWFLDSCWDEHVAACAAELLHRHDVNSVKSETLGDDYLASSGLQVAI
ncbi:reverse transcriptase [Legionella pneumophila]|nr:reverse transcriptase [Legionella pneumophila]